MLSKVSPGDEALAPVLSFCWTDWSSSLMVDLSDIASPSVSAKSVSASKVSTFIFFGPPILSFPTSFTYSSKSGNIGLVIKTPLKVPSSICIFPSANTPAF